MPAHPHAALMAEYAKDVMETDKPWERWQHFSEREGKWLDVVGHPLWISNKKYRCKTPTIIIGDMEVPAPCKVAPNMESDYYVPVTNNPNMFAKHVWIGDVYDHSALDNRVLHLTKEAAIQHAKALIKISGGSI